MCGKSGPKLLQSGELWVLAPPQPPPISKLATAAIFSKSNEASSFGFGCEKCDLIRFWKQFFGTRADETVYSTTVRPVWSTTVGRMLFKLRSTAAGGGGEEEDGGGGGVGDEDEDEDGGGS